MKSMRIYSITYSITDRGETFTPKKIETYNRNHNNAVHWFLKKNKYAMDLSNNYTFEVVNVDWIGYGSV